MTARAEDIFRELDSLLDEERNALVRGDLGRIASLLQDKEKLLETLAALDAPPPAGIEALQGKALRNQILLDSALRGIRTVATRFATLRRLRRSLETYDENGRKTTLCAIQEGNVEKRA